MRFVIFFLDFEALYYLLLHDNKAVFIVYLPLILPKIDFFS